MTSSTPDRVVDALILFNVFGLGIAVGGLLLEPTDADWVEAMGTWSGGGVALLAVLVASRSFLSERREHRASVEAERKARADEQERQLVSLAEQASLVDLEVGHTGPTLEDGRVQVSSVTYAVSNHSTMTIAGAVYLWHPLYVGPEGSVVQMSHHLVAGARAEHTIKDVRPELVDTQQGAQRRLQRDAWITFALGGQRWYKACGELTATTVQPDWWGVRFEGDEYGNSRIVISEEVLRDVKQKQWDEIGRMGRAAASWAAVREGRQDQPGADAPRQAE